MNDLHNETDDNFFAKLRRWTFCFS